MPTNRNALIRYTTIDKCLRNKYRRWTLEDLQEACSDALYEYEGIDKGVSKRTTQLDIQNMRSDKLGYNAPIIVLEKKYYTYEDADYSITKLPLTDNDLGKLKEAIDILKQFQGFNHFQEMSGLVHKLENKYYNKSKYNRTIVHIETNDALKGIEYLDQLYQTILNRKVISVSYQSYKARKPNSFTLHPYLLKEFNNRWYVVGLKPGKPENNINNIKHLALDRIKGFEIINDSYVDNIYFDPNTYYDNIIGVTKDEGLQARTIICSINHRIAPYIITKPIHHSQKVIGQSKYGVKISLKLIPNLELERVLLGFSPDLEVLSPPSLNKRIKQLLKHAYQKYK
ncbi:MAG: helix-turn-helix transcriptional regulator [Hyphomicrobiales bacterium]